MSDLITNAKDERLFPTCNDPQTSSPCREELFLDSLRAALSRAEAAEARLEEYLGIKTCLDIRGITLSLKDMRINDLETALRSIAGAVGEFADADGKNIVEKIEFLRKDWEGRLAEKETQLCRARERDEEAVKLIMAVVGNSLLNDPIFTPLLKRSREFYENATPSSAPCPHEAEAKMFKERYELEQIRYEGISSANEELRAEAKRLRGAVEWAIRNKESGLHQWQRDELRRLSAAK